MATSGKFHGNLRNVLGFRHLDRFAGSSMGHMQTFLYPFARQSVAYLEDDFLGDTINTDLYTTNAGTGATALAVPATQLVNGVIQGATGTDATGSNRRVNFYGAPVWQGDKNCGMEVRLKFSAVTDLQFEVGFIDTMTSITTAAPAMPDVDVPTTWAAGVGDAAIVVLDTEQTANTMGLLTLGSGSLNTGTRTAIGTLTPTAATYMTIRVQLVGNDVLVIIDEDPAKSVSDTAGIEGGTLVRPWFFIEGVTTTSRTVDIDYIRVWQDR